MERRICLITGATDGVGKATALELAGQGFIVVVVARDESKAKSLQSAMPFSGGPKIDYLICDLRSLAQVRRAAEQFKQRYPRLDILINNAGIFVPSRVVTEDRFESMYQVNYLSHFLLTSLLIGELKRSPEGRVINLTSSVYSMGRLDPNNLQSEKRFSAMGAYAASKLFMLMFSIELASKLSGTRVTANAVHPGVVRTHMMMNAPGIFKLISYLAMPFSISPAKGALTSIFLATHSNVKGTTGGYFVNSRRKNVNTKFDSDKYRKLLWDVSVENLRDWAAVCI